MDHVGAPPPDGLLEVMGEAAVALPSETGLFRSTVPPRPGTYVLVLSLPGPLRMKVGKLGKVRLEAGNLAYVGSARGPGGLAARVGRHIGPARFREPHWHIDRLLRRAHVAQVWWTIGDRPLECRWAHVLLRGGACDASGFGASDCRCPSHLISLGDQQGLRRGWRRLRAWCRRRGLILHRLSATRSL